MHVGFERCLAIPSECTVGKINVDAKQFLQGFPNGCHLLALRDAVGRDECCTHFVVAQHLRSFVVPASHIVNLSCGFEWFAFLIDENVQNVVLLPFALKRIAHERRIAHDVI